jgi:predicted site-specific integrase-resolvase
MTQKEVSSRFGISKTRIHRYLKKGMRRHHSSSVKSYLTGANKKTRLKWCIDVINQNLPDDPKFKDLFFIDEK